MLQKSSVLQQHSPAATLVMDFDSTIIREESLEILADIALASAPDRAVRRERICALTHQAMSGEIAFDRALYERIELLSAHKHHLEPLVEHLQTLITPSFEDCFESILAVRDHLYVMSGGFVEFIAPIMKRFGLDETHIIANRFAYAPDGAIIGVDTSLPLAWDDGKSIALRAMNLPRPLWMIGDGYSDYQVYRSGCADVFFAFTENIRRDKVVCHIDGIHVVELPNFTHLFARL